MNLHTKQRQPRLCPQLQPQLILVAWSDIECLYIATNSYSLAGSVQGAKHHETKQKVSNDKMQQRLNMLMHVEFATDSIGSCILEVIQARICLSSKRR